MRFLLATLLVLQLSFNSLSQVNINRKSFVIEKKASVSFESSSPDYHPSLLLTEMPKQGTKKMEIYNYPPNQHTQRTSQTSSVVPAPIKGLSFLGNPFSVNTPNDNDMAISDSGMVISVINTNIFVKNTKTNTNSPVKSLAAFTTPVNSKHQEFDPKVMYDPKMDRFVLVCLVGFVDTTSKVIVGFSQTSNPAGAWNLYTLPGNPLNNNLWTDYPMISMSEKELFLSVNLLYNDSSWQTGFVETIIWQMNKNNGYLGLPLNAYLHSGIKYNGKAIRNLCPAKGGSKLYKPNMYFVSNRNLASQNDTVFLVNVTDTIGSPTNTVTAKALVSNQPYYFPPNGRQTISTESLATNDCRNLGAFYENNKIQFVHNTKNLSNNFVTVNYGLIDNPQSNSPTVTGYVVPNGTMDFAYPNISYAGNSTTDNSAIITFDHSSSVDFPGSSAIRTDGFGNFSTVLRIQSGGTYVNLLTGGLERWGDYSGSQRRYNKTNEVWMSGYYGYSFSGSYPRAHAAWIAQLFTDTNKVYIDTASHVGINSQTEINSAATIFPNPAQSVFSVEINLASPEYLNFELMDAQGKRMDVLLRDWIKAKQSVFSFNTQDLTKGVYFLKITGNHTTSLVKKIVIN